MRKFITAGMAVAMLAIPAAASASVNVNDAGVGTVGKGDVQSVLGFNDAEMQSAWNDRKVKFTGHTWLATETRWQCGDHAESRTSKVVQDSKISVTANTNKAGKLTSGWDLNGVGVGGSYVSGGYSGAPYVGYCASGAFTGFLPAVFTNGVESGIYVNGISLPNTPVEIAPVA